MNPVSSLHGEDLFWECPSCGYKEPLGFPVDPSHNLSHIIDEMKVCAMSRMIYEINVEEDIRQRFLEICQKLELE